jgi:hypothetical protein
VSTEAEERPREGTGGRIDPNIASHSKEQDLYFGADGLLRRMITTSTHQVASQPHSMFQTS